MKIINAIKRLFGLQNIDSKWDADVRCRMRFDALCRSMDSLKVNPAFRSRDRHRQCVDARAIIFYQLSAECYTNSQISRATGWSRSSVLHHCYVIGDAMTYRGSNDNLISLKDAFEKIVLTKKMRKSLKNNELGKRYVEQMAI